MPEGCVPVEDTLESTVVIGACACQGCPRYRCTTAAQVGDFCNNDRFCASGLACVRRNCEQLRPNNPTTYVIGTIHLPAALDMTSTLTRVSQELQRGLQSLLGFAVEVHVWLVESPRARRDGDESPVIAVASTRSTVLRYRVTSIGDNVNETALRTMLESSTLQNEVREKTDLDLEFLEVEESGRVTALEEQPARAVAPEDDKASSTSMIVIVGAACGAVVLVALAIAAVVMARRRNSERVRVDAHETQAGMATNPGFEQHSVLNVAGLSTNLDGLEAEVQA